MRRREDGAIEFVGRADRQLKVRGMRVEPAEIERVLRRHDGVADAVVVPHDGRGGDLALTSTGRVVPESAFFMGESHVQGALGHGGTYWLSSSRPAGGAGELDRVKVNAATVRLPWSDSPEDLAFDPQGQTIWSLSEGVDSRYLFEIALSAVD